MTKHTRASLMEESERRAEGQYRWKKQGVIVIHPTDIKDDWTRRAVVNEAERLFGEGGGGEKGSAEDLEAINAELLEALKEMVSLHEPYNQVLGKPGAAAGLYRDVMGCNALSRARAAIRKAEGSDE